MPHSIKNLRIKRDSRKLRVNRRGLIKMRDRQVIYPALGLNQAAVRRAVANAMRLSYGQKYIIIMRPSDGSNYTVKVYADSPEAYQDGVGGYKVVEVKKVDETQDYQAELVKQADKIVGTLISSKQIPKSWVVTKNTAFDNQTPRDYIIQGKSRAVVKALEAADVGVPL